MFLSTLATLLFYLQFLSCDIHCPHVVEVSVILNKFVNTHYSFVEFISIFTEIVGRLKCPGITLLSMTCQLLYLLTTFI